MSKDVKISQIYRELGTEEPPRALDEAILAAARRKAGAAPSIRSSRQRWYAPLAAAAVLVLAIAVTLQMQIERPDVESPAPQAAAPAAAKETAIEVANEAVIASRKKDQPVPAAPAPKVSPAAEPKPFVADSVATPAPTPGEAARSEAAGASGALARQAEERGSRNDQAERAPQLRSSRAMAKREGSADMQAVPQQVETPERELERIAELRAQGRHDEADRALAEFRKRYPDFRVSETMRERVERR